MTVQHPRIYENNANYNIIDMKFTQLAFELCIEGTILHAFPYSSVIEASNKQEKNSSIKDVHQLSLTAKTAIAVHAFTKKWVGIQTDLRKYLKHFDASSEPSDESLSIWRFKADIKAT